MKKKKLLVVDDSSLLRLRMRRLFENRNFDIFEAKNGQEAVTLANDMHPDIITLDYEMPLMNGVETCRQIKTNESLAKVPIIMLTSRDSDGIKQEAFEAGIYEFFNKDNLNTLLVNYIENYLKLETVVGFGSKILVVEDSNFIVSKIKSLLLTAGYRCEAFTTAEDCHAYIDEKSDFDLILLDVNLPQMSGLEFITLVRKKYTFDQLPIIVMSAINNHSMVIEAFINGANDFITKPFQGDELIVRLRSHLKLHQLQSELVKKNDILETTNDKLEKLNEIKDDFIGMAAHDLRNPLTTLKQAVNLISEGICSTKEEETDMYQIMDRQIDQMVSLLEELLSINKIETGRLDISANNIDLESYIQEIQQFNRLSAKKKNMKLEIMNEAGDITIKIDTSKITQVINNFISNGLKYSESGSTLKVTFSKSDPISLKVEVIDEGQGIPEREHPQVFEAFSKISSKPTGDETSTGLGLAICKKIIVAHGGTVGFTSVPGLGSTFYFDLPGVIID